jgi:hypothetical protein
LFSEMKRNVLAFETVLATIATADCITVR